VLSGVSTRAMDAPTGEPPPGIWRPVVTTAYFRRSSRPLRAYLLDLSFRFVFGALSVSGIH
jgi:hypothetical protein